MFKVIFKVKTLLWRTTLNKCVANNLDSMCLSARYDALMWCSYVEDSTVQYSHNLNLFINNLCTLVEVKFYNIFKLYAV